MIQFLQNIGNWFVINKDQILIGLGSIDFVGLFTTIYLLWKNRKSTKDNTSATETLNTTIATNAKTNETVSNIDQTANDIHGLLIALKTFTEKMDEKTDTVLAAQTDKLNAMIEVQSIVYSTIKDEKVRNTVNNLLVNAKYAETATRAELQKQVEELKAAVADKVQELNSMVEKTTDRVVSVVTGNKNEVSQETIERY